MPIQRRIVNSSFELSEVQKKQIALSETAIDALLQLNGYVSVVLMCTQDVRIREELESMYTRAGWKVRFLHAGSPDSKYFFIDIEP